jgi:hypothetical protein
MLRDGVPIAIFGVAPHKRHPGVGIVWLLGTPEVDRAAKALVKQGRYYVDLMQQLFPMLMNLVDIENSRTRRWLRALGFTEGHIHQTVAGHPFILIKRGSLV